MTAPSLRADRLFDMSGRHAFVTGAASGLGAAMAAALAENGAHVTCADLSLEGVERLCAALHGRGFAAEAIGLDVADYGAVETAIAEDARRHGRLDAVFVNAGTSAGPGYGSPEGTIDTVSFDLWERSMRVNLTGAFATMKAAAAVMKSRREGSIVVTASISALKVSPLPAYAYHAAKAGIAQTVRVAAKELGPFGVRVNAIAPGPFGTNMANGRLRDPEAAAKFAATVPLGRVAEPHEIAGLALLLASPASSFISGAIIPIDGGDSA